jgi:hypothetical protein
MAAEFTYSRDSENFFTIYIWDGLETVGKLEYQLIDADTSELSTNCIYIGLIEIYYSNQGRGYANELMKYFLKLMPKKHPDYSGYITLMVDEASRHIDRIQQIIKKHPQQYNKQKFQQIYPGGIKQLKKKYNYKDIDIDQENTENKILDIFDFSKEKDRRTKVLEKFYQKFGFKLTENNLWVLKLV